MARQSLTMQQNFNAEELVEQNELFENDSDWFDIESNEDTSDWFDSNDFNLPESENDF